jgi:hypothetical protein
LLLAKYKFLTRFVKLGALHLSFRKTDIGHTTQGFSLNFQTGCDPAAATLTPAAIGLLLSTSKKDAPYYIVQVALTAKL